MFKAARILIGTLWLGLLLGVASWAVRDCPVAPYVYENCIWLSVRDHYHLRQSKVLRAAVLEAIGLVLLAGLFFDIRYVFPGRPAKLTRPKDVNVTSHAE